MVGNDNSTRESLLEFRHGPCATEPNTPHEKRDASTWHERQEAGREQDRAEDPLSQTRQPQKNNRPGAGMLDRSLQAKLGSQLRAIYSDVANEPVPDRFIRLLGELEAREKRR